MRKPGLLYAALLGGLLAAVAVPVKAGPEYEFDRHQLEAMLDDMKTWLPGAWDSYPQVWYERNVAMPAEGEHEHWHRTFALIDAPQVGTTVFYGQINIDGRDGPIMARSQVLYKAVIDEERRVINIAGQPLAEPERFANLHDHPELWSEVRMRDEAALNCDFIWRRDGRQLVGVLEGKTPEGRQYGPGTCSYTASSGAEFFGDAEWVLTPDELWLYDINKLRGVQFIGRADRTHIRLYRARPYTCELATPGTKSPQSFEAHDRGYTVQVLGEGGKPQEWLLLRAWYPVTDGKGLADQLRLMRVDAESGDTLAMTAAEPLAATIALEIGGAGMQCTREQAFPPMAQ